MTRLHERIRPVFADVTWGAGGSTSALSMQLATHIAQDATATDTLANLHLTCTNMIHSTNPQEELRTILNTAQDNGIYNIVALRGDAPAGVEEGAITTHQDFTCALDLVRFIRAEFGDTFGISVAGYPEGHPVAITPVVEKGNADDDSTISENHTRPLTDSERARSSTDLESGAVYTCRDEDYQAELAYLKQKVDAGAGTYCVRRFLHVGVCAVPSARVRCGSFSHTFKLSGVPFRCCTLLELRLYHYANVF
jgi:methylenetetrahydrofolate reductase (NADPH)